MREGRTRAICDTEDRHVKNSSACVQENSSILCRISKKDMDRNTVGNELDAVNSSAHTGTSHGWNLGEVQLVTGKLKK